VIAWCALLPRTTRRRAGNVPIAGTFPLADWRTALEISLSGQARGKLLLLR
jgi:hypothetical protein